MAVPTYRLLALATMIGLGGCITQADQSVTAAVAPVARRVAILLPMTGPQAALGQAMQGAAQLALGSDGPALDVFDTTGTPAGATTATQAALAAHDALILGPLTAPETAAAAAAAHGTPILAFTSDRGQARSGVWALGIEPEQQVERLVQALLARGRGRLAAVLPDNAFGTALATGLSAAIERMPTAPDIRRYVTGNAASLQAALRDASGYADRHGALEARARDARAPGGEDSEQAAKAILAEPVPPPNFDALLLAEAGPLLKAAASDLAADDIRPPDVQVVGPATWAREAANLRGLAGAWYAAPDPAAREDFVRAFTARTHAAPPLYADLAYDAARLARTAVDDPAILTRRQGFVGVDGPYTLLPDGHVRRDLSVFAVGPHGPVPIDQAPGT